MAIESVSRIMQYLALDTIERSAAAFGRERGYSQIAIGVKVPTLSAGFSNVALQLYGPLRSSNARSDADGNGRRQRGNTGLPSPRAEQSVNTGRRVATISLSLLHRFTGIAAIAASFIPEA